MESYETVIIGSGPAGLACAGELSRAGKRALLLEQNDVIGPKVCAGGISSEVVKYFKLPEELLDCMFNEIVFHTPLQKGTLKLDGPFYTVDRKNLGQWQLKKINNDNVRVRANSRVTKIEKDYVIVNNSEKIQFKYLVGADGSNSMARKFVGLQTRDLIVAIQYIISADIYKKTEIFFDPKSIDLGYIWIFPHKGYVSIGCGCEPRLFSAKDLAAGFQKWLEKSKIDVSEGKFEAHPINYDYRGYKFGNIFLAGDAAGLAAGLTGGGIYQALVSGEEIAKTIMDKNYESKKMEEILAGNEKQNNALRFMEKTRFCIRLEMEIFMLMIKNERIGRHLIGRMM